MDSRDICKVLETYNEGGYTDWYVPAFGQLYEFYSNKKNIEEALTSIGGTVFNPTNYWSSTEKGSQHAWVINFVSGGIAGATKSNYSSCMFVRDLQ
jgi:hypothetical protein